MGRDHDTACLDSQAAKEALGYEDHRTEIDALVVEQMAD